MAIKNTLLGGTDITDITPFKAVDYNDTNDAIGYVPVGSLTSWLKTFTSQSTGTADTNTVDELVNSSATFQTDGVVVGMIIHNTTDNTFGIVGSVDSETAITIVADIQSGSSITDVFPLGTEAYVIYATPKLQAGWVECNGQTLSDAGSIYNGSTIPDLNSGTYKMLRGSVSSGTTAGSDTHNHQWANNGGSSITSFGTAGGSYNTARTYTSAGTNAGDIAQANIPVKSSNFYTALTTAIPAYYEVVMILRIK